MRSHMDLWTHIDTYHFPRTRCVQGERYIIQTVRFKRLVSHGHVWLSAQKCNTVPGQTIARTVLSVVPLQSGLGPCGVKQRDGDGELGRGSRLNSEHNTKHNRTLVATHVDLRCAFESQARLTRRDVLQGAWCAVMNWGAQLWTAAWTTIYNSKPVSSRF